MIFEYPFTYGKCGRCVFHGRNVYLLHKVFRRTYLHLAKEVNKILILDNLGFMTVSKIKKHVLRINRSNIGP